MLEKMEQDLRLQFNDIAGTLPTGIRRTPHRLIVCPFIQVDHNHQNN